MLGIGLAFLLAGVLVAARTALFVWQAQSAVATYIDSVGHHSTKYGQILHSRFVFTPAPGRSPQIIESANGSSDGLYHEGAKVRVHFDAAHPEQARIGSWGEMWAAPTVLTIPGLVLVLIAVLLARSSRRRRELARSATSLLPPG